MLIENQTPNPGAAETPNINTQDSQRPNSAQNSRRDDAALR